MKKVIPFSNTPNVPAPVTTSPSRGHDASPEAPADLLHGAEQQLALLQRLVGCASEHALLKRFFEWTEELGLADGMRFTDDTGHELIHLGRRRHHSSQYALALNEETLGVVVLCRRERYTEGELLAVEQGLSALARCLKLAFEQTSLHRLATRDALTGLGNRSSLDQWLRTEISRTRRHNTPLAVMMIDIDKFKPLNDSLGHLAGDRVLRAFARVFESSTRSSDLIFRYGGDEFAILMPHTDLAGANRAAELIRRNIGRIPNSELGLEEQYSVLRPDVSVGVAACVSADDETSLLQRADTHLYHAKSAGRGRVCSSL